MSTNERILEKIQKCLALSQSSEPNEAAAALRQAQKLMELHGVTQTDLSCAEIGTAQIKSKVSVSRLKDWETLLVDTIAKAFGCRLVWSKSSSYSDDVFGMFTIIGLKTQVPVAQYTIEVMQRKLMKSRNNFVASLSDNYIRSVKIKEADGFCHGWVAAVSKVVHEFALSNEIKDLVSAKIAEIATGYTKAQVRKCGAMGFYAGQEAGSGESIYRPMGQDTYRALS